MDENALFCNKKELRSAPANRSSMTFFDVFRSSPSLTESGSLMKAFRLFLFSGSDVDQLFAVVGLFIELLVEFLVEFLFLVFPHVVAATA